MQNIIDFFDLKISPIAGRISSQKHLKAIRDGLVLAMPILVIGSFFAILSTDFPIPAYGMFMVGLFGDGWDNFIWNVVANSTTNLTALIAVMGISYSLALSYHEDGIVSAALSLPAFFLLNSVTETGGWDVSMFGAAGLFIAIITAMATTEIYCRVVKKDWVIHLPDSVPESISRSFVALVPGLFIILLFGFIHVLFTLTEYGTASNFIVELLQKPMIAVSTSYGGIMFTNFFISLFWCFGLHGDMIVNSIATPLIQAGFLENVSAMQAGMTIPNIGVDGFTSLFLQVGGTGCTLALTILCAFTCKSKQLKTVGRLSIAPAIFNINEPVIFGLPIVLNPLLMIPFILVPLVCGSLTYLAMYIGLVDKIVALPPWTCPMIFSGFLSTGGDWRAAILQIINLFLSMLIYYPFLRIYDKKQYELETVAEIPLETTNA